LLGIDFFTTRFVGGIAEKIVEPTRPAHHH
jgi:hypothetical protein